MRLGVTMFLTDRSLGPVELATAVEERGFSGLYIPEHTHIPTSRVTPPPTGDETLADEYRRTMDPYVALAAAAAVTSRVRLGTGISLVAQHDPIALAKQIATLDVLSGGRFVLGFGFGWNREEMADHGVDYGTRRERVREHMLCMQALWSQEEASFDGSYVSLSPSWAWPKPVQQPRPVCLIGGAPGPKLFAHAAEYADGWIPVGGSGLSSTIPQLREAFAAAGRDTSSIEVVPFGTLPDPGKLEHYRSIGVTEVVLRLPSAPADDVLPVLDGYVRFL